MKFRNVAVGVAVVGLLAACGRIETGNVGVRTDFNKTVESTELAPGWYGAFLTSVDEFSVKEIEVKLDDLKPKARDNLSLSDLDISVFYKIDSTKVAEMAIKYNGMDYVTPSGLRLPAYGLVERQSKSAVFQIVGKKYESLTVHQLRTELENDVMKQIQADLDAADPGVFIITKVIVRQVTTDVALEQSIRFAVQVQKEIEAKTQQILLAKSEAERLRVEAEGQAAANRALSASVTPMLVELKRIEMQTLLAKAGTHTVFMDTKSPITFNGVGK
jgi:regulator of protease activity HflC (stomatin/prohibitin superfamily)